jgi:hypothetical protein
MLCGWFSSEFNPARIIVRVGVLHMPGRCPGDGLPAVTGDYTVSDRECFG